MAWDVKNSHHNMLMDMKEMFCQSSAVKSAVSLALFLMLIFAACCSDYPQVFIGGQVYFADGDCYARMTRVRMVLEHPGTIIRHHDFENYPAGIRSHATAPLDYLIAALSLVMRPFTSDALDWAGAFVSPLLGVLTGVFLWFWSRRAGLPYRGAQLVLFAVSPIICHGFALGRPNHHALQMLLLSVALGTEWILWQRNSRAWNIAGAAAFAGALWISLYEPLVLFVIVLGLRLVFHRRLLFSRDSAIGYVIFACIIGLFLIVEWLPKAPDPVVIQYFKPWAATISEMKSVTPLSPLFYSWVGWLLIASPVLFVVAIFNRDRNARSAFVILLALYALSLWQIRWGYFFALYFVMTLPLQLSVLRSRKAAWTVFVISLLPVASAWDTALFSNKDLQAQQNLNATLMRDAAQHLKSRDTSPIMAPWWMCPALAYWSGQPAIAGTSHESLPGTVDSARFFLTTDLNEARTILRERKIGWVVACDPDNVSDNAAVILGKPAVPDSMISILFSTPSRAPDFLTFTYANSSFPYYKIYRVETDRL